MDLTGGLPPAGGVVPEGQAEVAICVALIAKVNEAVRAVTYHKRRSAELARRVQAIRPKLEEIQERGGLPLDQHGVAQNLGKSLQRAVEVMERSTQSRLLRALQYASLKEELDEVWGDISTALSDLHILGALEPRLPERFPNELHEGLEFGDAELEFRRGLRTGTEFVEEVLQENEVTEAEKQGCQEEMGGLLQQVESMSLQGETLARGRRQQEALFLRQILPLLAPLDTATSSSGADSGCRTVLPGHLCSICNSPMLDPVITEAGHSYCRGCITSWLETHNTDPNTNTKLAEKRLVKNVGLRQAVEEELKAMEPFASLPQEAWGAHLGSYMWKEGSTIPSPWGDRQAALALAEPLDPPPVPPPAPPPAPPPLLCIQTLNAKSAVLSLALAPLGDLFSGHDDGSVRQWRGSKCIAILQGHEDWVHALAVGPDGLLFSGSDDTTVRQWLRGRCRAKLTGHTDFVRALLAAPDGSVYSGSADTTIRQWFGGECIAKLRGHTDSVWVLALAADGALVSGGADGTIRQWRRGKCVVTLNTRGGQGLNALAVAPNGFLYSGGIDVAIRQWRGWICTATLEGHTDQVGALAVGPDGSLFSGSKDKSVRQWRNGRCAAVLKGHTGEVLALAVAPDGSLFSGSWDGTILEWH